MMRRFPFSMRIGGWNFRKGQVSDVGRKQQWRQHTKASVFAERFMWKFRANRKQWDIAIANHAGRGQLPRSMLSLFGSPTPCGLLQVRNMLPRFKRPN